MSEEKSGYPYVQQPLQAPTPAAYPGPAPAPPAGAVMYQAAPVAGYPAMTPQAPLMQPVMVQPMMAPPGAVVVQQVLVPARFGDVPQMHQCQFCGFTGPTNTRHVNGNLVWLSMGGLVLLGCWLGCCLIPLCIDSLKDVEHTCANCGSRVGYKSRTD